MNTDNKTKQLTPDEAVAAIKQAYSLLVNVTNSRHVIFTSPSPSSTECAARNNIRKACSSLDIAMSLMRL